jgi:hypothetical protein
MYSVEAAQSRRLIIISGAGRVTAQELQAAVTKVRELVADFTPGFQALTDFRFLDSMDPAAAPHIAHIMDALAAKHVASVLRVMPDPRKDIGLNILSQFHYGPGIRILTFETLADAIECLGADES